MMSRRGFLDALGAGALGTAAPTRPNIVIIMADDMGFSDIGCYGGEIRTPNLDRLANNGTRFTQFYNTARCCPTRASLVTGLYPHQSGMGHMADTPRLFPGYTGDLSPNCVTIAEVLKGAGYRTYMSGKWHVTPVNEFKHNWPLQRGFDRFFGTIHGAGSFYDPVTLARDNEPIAPGGPDFFYTDAIGQDVESNIRSNPAGDPFFIYVPFTSPHWPMHAIESDIARYQGRYKDGWDALRATRHKRMTAMGLVDKRWTLTARDSNVPAWTEAPNREWQQRRMEVYAAMVDRMDHNIGRMLRALEDTRQLDNTLILFLADNGGCAEELGPKAAARHIPLKTRDGRTVLQGNRPDLMPGGPETYQSYGLAWANASNTPFRLYKHWVHEGGIASPLIAHWPGNVQAGAITHEPGHLIDLMATCADVAGAQYPAARKGVPVQPMEGVSLRPAFTRKRLNRRQPLFWEHEGNRAIRDGKWKLVSRYPGDWELYDMQADRTEMVNLAARQADRVRAMSGAWDQWAARVKVVPWGEVAKPAVPGAKG
ncbi:MAG: arylsulfatase [Acidobacteria bacterium]|nr:arylsulfatase [Acidobacteriota bacterium]